MGAEAAGMEQSRRDWRLWFGVTVTVGWIALGSQYVLSTVGWSRFTQLPADGLGGFLEGAFAPLAFLWLVIGFFLQQRELTANTEAIRQQYLIMQKTAEQAEVQARAITRTALHQEQETCLKVADAVSRQLGVMAGFLYMSSQVAVEDAPEGVVEEVSDFWARLGSGDPEVFSRQLMAVYFRSDLTDEQRGDLFFSTEVRQRHTANFAATFERMIRSAETCDPERTIRDALEGSAHGHIYRFMQQHAALRGTA